MSTTRYAQIEEERLVVRALLGDMAAFDELARRYRGAVLLVARQTLGSREGAEDIAQEALLLAFKALPKLRDPSKFAGWLCAITRHRARRVAAKEGRIQPAEPSRLDALILAHSPALTDSPDEALQRQHDRRHLADALEKLSLEYRLVLQLRYYQEWPLARIAAFLSLPVTTVKWRLHHGRHLLRHYLDANEGDNSHGKKSRTDRCRTPQNPPSAARNGAAGGAGQPHGQPEQRQPHRYSPV